MKLAITTDEYYLKLLL